MESILSSYAKKIILVSNKNYSSRYADILVFLLKRKIELFCSVGTDCEKWEEALDLLCKGKDGVGVDFVYTTSHPKEELEEVKEFASKWPVEGVNEVQIIKI